MKKVIRKMKALWCDESAQGATEYILILAIIVGVALLFGKELKEIVMGKIGDVGGKIKAFDINGG